VPRISGLLSIGSLLLFRLFFSRQAVFCSCFRSWVSRYGLIIRSYGGRFSNWAKDFSSNHNLGSQLMNAKEILVEHQVLQTQRNDAATIDRKVMGVPGKLRYYVIDDEKLADVIAAISDPAT
jgi:hypothetical protein